MYWDTTIINNTNYDKNVHITDRVLSSVTVTKRGVTQSFLQVPTWVSTRQGHPLSPPAVHPSLLSLPADRESYVQRVGQLSTSPNPINCLKTLQIISYIKALQLALHYHKGHISTYVYTRQLKHITVITLQRGHILS